MILKTVKINTIYDKTIRNLLVLDNCDKQPNSDRILIIVILHLFEPSKVDVWEYFYQFDN